MAKARKKGIFYKKYDIYAKKQVKVDILSDEYLLQEGAKLLY